MGGRKDKHRKDDCGEMTQGFEQPYGNAPQGFPPHVYPPAPGAYPSGIYPPHVYPPAPGAYPSGIYPAHVYPPASGAYPSGIYPQPPVPGPAQDKYSPYGEGMPPLQYPQGSSYNFSKSGGNGHNQGSHMTFGEGMIANGGIIRAQNSIDRLGFVDDSVSDNRMFRRVQQSIDTLGRIG